MKERRNERASERTSKQASERAKEGQKDVRTEGRKDGRTEGRKDGRVEGSDLNQKFADKPGAVVHVILESCFDIQDQGFPSENDVHDDFFDVVARLFKKRLS